MLRQIPCQQAILGMYIHGFGGTWMNHPFWRAKFRLETEQQVAKVRGSGVPFIIVDDEKGVAPPDPVNNEPVTSSAPSPIRPHLRLVADAPRPADQKRDKDRQAAVALVSRSKKVMKRVFESARLGRAVRLPDVTPIVDEITQSVSSNAHALLSVIRKKDADEYTYFHSVAVCTLMVNVGRHLRLDEAVVTELGLAGLLHDIGKMGVPDDILNKPGRLTDEEFQLVRSHPGHGHEMLRDVPDLSPAALDVCLHHHEKMDGSGYPFGHPAEKISIAARLGAICDVYDALTSDRIYKSGWQPQEAVAAMWRWEGHFDPELLFAFMTSIGVFPPGMLVSVRSNRLAIILENKRRASRPRVLAFYSTRDKCPLPPETVTIRDDLSGDQILAPENPSHWALGDWESLREHLLSGGTMEMPLREGQVR